MISLSPKVLIIVACFTCVACNSDKQSSELDNYNPSRLESKGEIQNSLQKKSSDTSDRPSVEGEYLPLLPQEYKDRLDTSDECQPFWVKKAPIGLAGYLKNSNISKSHGLKYKIKLLDDKPPIQTFSMIGEFDSTDITLNVEIDVAFGIFMTRLKGLSYETHFTPDTYPTPLELSELRPGDVLRFDGKTKKTRTVSGKETKETILDAEFSVRFEGCSAIDINNERHQTAIWTSAVLSSDVDDFLGITTKETEYHSVELSKNLNWFIGRTNDEQTAYSFIFTD